MMFFTEPEHGGVHRLMRRVGYRPYAIFPGPDLDTLAVVVRSDKPACLLIQQTSAYGWLREASLETVETNMSRLHQEGQALAERLGCPVACLIVVYQGPVREHRWRSLSEIISQHQVTPVLVWKEQWPTDLIWIQPTTQVASPPLPPYPQRTHWSAHTEPSWWLEHLRALNEADDRQRKKQARFLAGTALTYLKEIPARLWLEGPGILAAARETLQALPAYLDRIAGRRYLYWLGFYMAGACLAGHAAQRDSDTLVLNFLHYLLEDLKRWTTRERRLIMRGLEMLIQKSADHALPSDTPLGQFLTGLFSRLIQSDDFLELAKEHWRAELHMRQLAETLARCGYIPPQTWVEQWERHNLQHNILYDACRGLIEHLMRAPSPTLWQLIHRTVPEKEQEHALAWHLYTNDWVPAFWDLVAGEDMLLSTLVNATLASLKSEHIFPSPQSLERVRDIVQHKLQTPSLPSWLRNRLEAALPNLMEAPGKGEAGEGLA